jgi:membrane peptidoglycan carboxypeptidase
MLGALLGTLGFSALAGVLVAVLVTPAIAVAGATVNNSVGIFDSLPNFIEISPQPEQNRIFAVQDGQPVQIATMFSQNREEVAWDQVSDFVKDAAVSGEDRRFFEHGGVDIPGIARAAVKNIAGGQISEGASTITQQYVKNTFIQAALELPEDEQDAAYEAAIDDTFERKLKEMKLAISLEKEYTKEEILLAYLNIANFGGNTYGIEAAAQRYFATSALELTAAQSASLIATVQSPGVLRLDRPENLEGNKARRDVILNAMLNEGNITEAQHAEAIATPLDETTITLTEPSNGCMVANDHTRFFCDYVRNLVKDLPALGADAEAREASFRHGGYDIYTSLDMTLQVAAQQASWKYAPNNTTVLDLGSTTVSVEVGTGRILLMAQNSNYDNTLAGGPRGSTAVNYNTDREYGGSSGFQPGSTYKVFTLIEWLKAGHGINESVAGGPRTVSQSTFTDRCNGTPVGEPWQFKNDSGEGGSWTVANAVRRSVNGAFVSMAQKLDLCDIRETAESLGVHRADSGTLEQYPATILGTNEIAPLTMAAAYAGIASGGTYCDPIAVDRITGPDGTELPGQTQMCEKVLDDDVANTATFAMEAVMSGNGTAAASNPNDGTPYIGKTGTTDSSNQTWVIGASTKVATAVWVGNWQGSYPIRDFRAGGYSGGSIRHAIFKETAQFIDQKYPGDEFPDVSTNLIRGSGKPVPEVLGQSVSAATTLLEANGFEVEIGDTIDSTQPDGTVGGSSPNAGTVLSPDSEVTLYVSNGELVYMPDAVGNGDLDADAAVELLEDAGFEEFADETCVELSEDEEGMDGKVISTDPAAGTPYNINDDITLTVGRVEC